jgi:hypothetical protein
MVKVPFQVRSGTPPEPEIGESHFHTIEANVRKFRNCRDFSIDLEAQEAIREAARWYCVRTFMNADGATVADVKQAMKQLIASAGKLEKTIEQLTGPSNPNSTVISGYLAKHGSSDLEGLLYPLAGLKLSCERTITDVRRHERKGPDPDDAFDSLIWTLADIFAKECGVPTTNWSRNGKRNSPFMAFAWGVYTSLPHEKRKLFLEAFQGRVHRVNQRWKQVKKEATLIAS